MKLHALALLSLALGTTHAQLPLPDVPPPVPLSPAAEPPAPAAPPLAAPVSPAPAAAARPAAPLRLVFAEQVPFALNGVKGYETNSQVLEFPQERSAILRAQGRMTESLRRDVQHFAQRFERDPRDARFERTRDGEWRLELQLGVKVDLEATLRAVEAALTDPAGAPARVVYTRQLPQRTLDFFLQKGVTGLIGEGETNYRGSSPARIENIHVGTRRFQDVLVDAPVVSFNQLVGPITSGTGFVPGLVIAGDQTASGVGGGICQVSTTVFRSLYRAGLPIVERRNHSYQVRYYDPQGLDATIYQPTQDLKFRNDTGAPLWFQADWNDARGRLSIWTFGKPRAEQVVIGTPKVLSSRASPPPRFIEDASLAPGERVQIDWAAPGATIEVERLFVKSGEVVKREVLRSVYRPWPNIFRVAPGDVALAGS